MAKVLVRIYHGTTLIPERNMSDEETAVDAIEIEIGDNEMVRELELEMKGGPAYFRRPETPEEAADRHKMQNDPGVRSMVAGMGGTPVRQGPKRLMTNERDKSVRRHKYRLVTVEVVSDVDIPSQLRALGVPLTKDQAMIEGTAEEDGSS